MNITGDVYNKSQDDETLLALFTFQSNQRGLKLTTNETKRFALPALPRPSLPEPGEEVV